LPACCELAHKSALEYSRFDAQPVERLHNHPPRKSKRKPASFKAARRSDYRSGNVNDVAELSQLSQ